MSSNQDMRISTNVMKTIKFHGIWGKSGKHSSENVAKTKKTNPRQRDAAKKCSHKSNINGSKKWRASIELERSTGRVINKAGDKSAAHKRHRNHRRTRTICSMKASNMATFHAVRFPREHTQRHWLYAHRLLSIGCYMCINGLAIVLYS